MSDMNDTHMFIELFNKCGGTCHGCMLSPSERTESELKYTVEEFSLILDRLQEYGEKIGCTFRAVMAFGDFSSLRIDTQKQYLDEIDKRNMPIGLTTTLVEDSLKEQYEESLELYSGYDNIIIDITVDPLRIRTNASYKSRILSVINSRKLVAHLQILASNILISKISPEELAEFCLKELNTNNMFLGFTPTIENLQFRQYQYNINSAIDYVTRFYDGLGKDFLADEKERFLADSDSKTNYFDFLRTSFFIGSNFGVYLRAITMYGDIFFDGRNNSEPIGCIKSDKIEDIVSPDNNLIIRAEAINASTMLKSNFDCMNCKSFNHCKFNGVGLVRRHYKSFESKLNGCYGPNSV